MDDTTRPDGGTGPRPASPDEWLAAVEASDLPDDTKAFCRELAAHVGPDGTVDDATVAALLAEQDDDR